MGLFDNMSEKELKKMKDAEFIKRNISFTGNVPGQGIEIIDKETGVSYIFFYFAQIAGLSIRVNKDGTPMIKDLSGLDD